MTRAVIFDMFETLITHYHSPLYFGKQMAEDAGIPEDKFQALWRSTEYERTIGKLTLEETLEIILRENHCFSEALLNKIVEKRITAKEECFRQLHNEIIPMLSTLKKKGFLVGLISNCFSEEADVIRRSELFPYFNAVYLSYELGIQKPFYLQNNFFKKQAIALKILLRNFPMNKKSRLKNRKIDLNTFSIISPPNIIILKRCIIVSIYAVFGRRRKQLGGGRSYEKFFYAKVCITNIRGR